jgi:putative phosphoesterase
MPTATRRGAYRKFMPVAEPSRRSATLPLRSDGTLTLVVVADTHAQPHPAIDERLAALRPDAILHAGDIGDDAVIDRLGRSAPVYAVRGNIDGRSTHPDVWTIDLVGGERRLRIFMTHIAVNGPRLRADVLRAARAEQAALVVCGHSHVPFIGRDHEFAVFNPGSIGPRRFSLPIVFGVISVGPDGVRLAHFDCATGEPWRPPG